MATGPKDHRQLRLTDAEWFHVYRLLCSRQRRLTQEDVYGAIELVLWDRGPCEFVCHGGVTWTL
jgi:hypothetical protein